MCRYAFRKGFGQIKKKKMVGVLPSGVISSASVLVFPFSVSWSFFSVCVGCSAEIGVRVWVYFLSVCVGIFRRIKKNCYANFQ